MNKNTLLLAKKLLASAHNLLTTAGAIHPKNSDADPGDLTWDKDNIDSLYKEALIQAFVKEKKESGHFSTYGPFSDAGTQYHSIYSMSKFIQNIQDSLKLSGTDEIKEKMKKDPTFFLKKKELGHATLSFTSGEDVGNINNICERVAGSPNIDSEVNKDEIIITTYESDKDNYRQ